MFVDSTIFLSVVVAGMAVFAATLFVTSMIAPHR